MFNRHAYKIGKCDKFIGELLELADNQITFT